MEKWVNKVALVTGASSGIGKAIVYKLITNGVNVVACARNLEKLKDIANKLNGVSKAGGTMFPIKCDLRNEDEILSVFKFIDDKFAKIHICINNAGLSWDAPILSGKTKEWKEMFDVNVMGVAIVAREACSLMRKAGIDDGIVVNINSMSGHRIVGLPMYAASKFAVTAITEGLRKELREIKSRIRTTSISPGSVDTEFESRMYRGDAEISEIKYLQADDIASAVIFALTSPAHMDVNEIYIRPTEQEG